MSRAYLVAPFHSSVIIDPNTSELLRINFNITALDTPCEFATIDVVDVLGTRTDNVTKNVNRWQLDGRGVRKSYEGRNREQADLQHDIHDLDIEEYHRNGVHAIPLTEGSFDEWVKTHPYTFVDFYAPWYIDARPALTARRTHRRAGASGASVLRPCGSCSRRARRARAPEVRVLT